MSDNDEPRQRRSSSGRAKLIALIFVLLLAGFAVWLVNGIIADTKLQNCIFSGRRDCVQIAPDTGGR